MLFLTWFYLAAAFSLNAIANILLKIGASGGRYLPVVAGLVAFAANAWFYYLALRFLPLSVAYPVMVVMSFVIINTYAYYRLHESITGAQWLGYLLILTGLSLVVWWQAPAQ
jgi:multidrug transporter EmrE-like cation transporter